jgi:hypothetical protein
MEILYIQKEKNLVGEKLLLGRSPFCFVPVWYGQRGAEKDPLYDGVYI